MTKLVDLVRGALKYEALALGEDGAARYRAGPAAPLRVDEVDGGVVSNYEVLDGNPSDQESWEPALTQSRPKRTL